MQTQLPADVLQTDAGREADRILRSCVHCGFCNATCPTYQVDGNELDGPRGRIYLIKQMLEGNAVTEVTRTHLDRCLTCQACETTCPSGVDYHQLLEIGRDAVELRAPRPLWQKWMRAGLVRLMESRRVFAALLSMGRVVRPILPRLLKTYVPRRRADFKSAPDAHSRQVILVQGCVQPGLSPTTATATQRVLSALGIATVTAASEQCCGALGFHLNETERALHHARHNIGVWTRLLDAGAEAIVMNASGCSNFVQDYGRLLADDPDWAEPAQRVVAALTDIGPFLQQQDLSALQLPAASERISWHCPCTAQHGQKLDASVRDVLTRLGFELPVITDAHLCCGSAGTQSLFQARVAGELRERKLAALEASQPQQIVTANIGCQVHLAGGTETPVVHWIELVARALEATLHCEAGQVADVRD